MKYHHLRGAIIKKSKVGSIGITAFAVLLFAAGGYLLVNTFAPVLPIFATDEPSVAETVKRSTANTKENRVYIPSINVDVKVVEIKDYPNEEKALLAGAIHRAPNNGSPDMGGNFVLAAHRFNLGLTPNETRAKSPFYNLNKVNEGDQIFVDWNGTRYAYEVSKRYLVSPSAVEIENRSDDPKITIYSCELSGPESGREVADAKLLGTVKVVDGKQMIEKVAIN